MSADNPFSGLGSFSFDSVSKQASATPGPSSLSNFSVAVVDDHGPSAMSTTETKMDATHPQKKKKMRKAKPAQFATGPTNREQFQKLYEMTSQLQTYIAMLEGKVNRLEQDNNNLKAIISLSNIAPCTGPKTVNAQQLPQIYGERLAVFHKCMK